jgi:hypothetical protein
MVCEENRRRIFLSVFGRYIVVVDAGWFRFGAVPAASCLDSFTSNSRVESKVSSERAK